VDSPKTSRPSFETALTQLETIVEAMEQGEVPLAELMKQFEEGTKLLQLCETRLKDAEIKLEQLKQTRAGAPAFEAFAPARGE